MTSRKRPVATDEENANRTAAYHRGADNSIERVTRAVRDARLQQGGSLSGISDADMRAAHASEAHDETAASPPIDEIRDPGDGKTEPEAQRQQASEPLRGRSIVPDGTRKMRHED